MTEPMASEPAEPTTRHQDDVIERATRRRRSEADARLDGLALKAAAGDQVALEQTFALTLGVARRYWTLNRVRAALGTPDGRAVSVHAAEVRKERDTWESEYERVRDLKLTDLADALAERDERQARIDAALAKVNGWIAKRSIDQYAYLLTDELLQLRAALVGDQPKAEEPKPRCCIGPFADGTHAPGCLDACQDCGGDEAGPHRCQCGDVDPVCTCTPSRCDYDGYPLDGPACLPCGQRPVGKPCLAIDDTPRAVEEAADAAEPHHSPPPDPASLTEGEA